MYALRSNSGYVQLGPHRVLPAITPNIEMCLSRHEAESTLLAYLHNGQLPQGTLEGLNVVPDPRGLLRDHYWWIDESGQKCTIREFGIENLEFHSRGPGTWVEVWVLGPQDPEGREVLGQFVLHRGPGLDNHQEVQPSEIGL